MSSRLEPRDALAEAQHLDAVGDLEHLGHVVADQDDREPAVAHAADQVEHAARLHDAERGRRLVHEDDLARPRHRAAIATPWRWPPDMFATGALRPRRDAEVAERLLGAPAHRGLVEEAELAEQAARRISRPRYMFAAGSRSAASARSW